MNTCTQKCCELINRLIKRLPCLSIISILFEGLKKFSTAKKFSFFYISSHYTLLFTEYQPLGCFFLWKREWSLVLGP